MFRRRWRVTAAPRAAGRRWRDQESGGRIGGGTRRRRQRGCPGRWWRDGSVSAIGSSAHLRRNCAMTEPFRSHPSRHEPRPRPRVPDTRRRLCRVDARRPWGKPPPSERKSERSGTFRPVDRCRRSGRSSGVLRPARPDHRKTGAATAVLREMALYATPFSFRKGPYFLSVPWMCLISQFFRKFITSMLSVAVAPAWYLRCTSST